MEPHRRPIRGLKASLVAAPLLLLACDRPENGSGETYHLRAAAKVEHDLGTAEGYRSAAELLAKLVRRRPSDTDDLMNYARSLVFADLPGAANPLASVLESLRHRLPAASTDLLYLEGLQAKRQGDPAAAASRFREVVERDPGCVPSWYQLAAARSSLKESEGALLAYRKVVELDRGYFAEGALNSIHLLLRRLGRNEEADRWLERFKTFKEERAKTAPPGNPPAEFYELCRYTRMTLVPARRAEVEPGQPALSYRDITAGCGLGREAQSGVTSLTAFDADGDGDLDLFLTREGSNLLLRNDLAVPAAPREGAAQAGGSLVDITELSNAGGGPGAAGSAAGDFNNDGLPDLYLAGREGGGLLLKGLGEGVFQPLTRAGLGEGSRTLAARWVDFDHDGDLDLALLETVPSGEARGRIFRNNGDETFQAPPDGPEDLLPGGLGRLPAGEASFEFADLDLGNDIDLVFPGAAGVVLFLNRREGPFRRQEIAAGPCARVLSGDLDDDGDPDLLLPPSPGAPLRVVWNEDPSAAGGPRLKVERPAASASLPEAADAVLADLDNDGDLDLALATAEGLRIACNRRGGGMEPAPPGAEPAFRTPLRALAAVDLDGDGLVDLAAVTRAGALLLLKAGSAPRYPSVAVRLRGTRDNREGTGSLVELFAGKLYQAREAKTTGATALGLGGASREEIDGLRITWPNGVVQAVARHELHWDSKGTLLLVEKSGLNVSCPFLFGFDGESMRFLTDVVGIAPLDEWLPEGASPLIIPEEHVRIAGERLAPRGGRIELAITEELRETTYLDAAELIEATGPAGFELTLDESTRRGAPAPLTVQAIKLDQVRPPSLVRGPRGEEALSLVRETDGRYLHAYLPGPEERAGWVEPAALEIDLLGPTEPALLLLTGRIAWPDSDGAFAVSQSRRRWPPPRLEVLAGTARGRGDWTTAFADIGFPSGMDRTLALPLPAGSRRARIVAGHRFLWDRIALAGPPLEIDLSVDGMRSVSGAGGALLFTRRTLPLLQARLEYHGRSAVVGDPERHEESYDFAAAAPGAPFLRAGGLATRYGDVLPLLEAADDRLVVMVAGDGLRFEFQAPEPLPRGPGGSARRRTYFLHLTGWAKEGSFHNRTGRWIAPLPFRAMGRYPPPGSPPADGSYREYLTTYQTRWVER